MGELEYPWVMYCTRQNNKVKPAQMNIEAWKSKMTTVCVMRTIDEFWGVYNNLRQPEDILNRGDYYLFKDGILPEWEDPMNSEGGSWVINLSSNTVNLAWETVLLALIGASVGAAMHHICGGVLTARRRMYKVLIWVDSI